MTVLGTSLARRTGKLRLHTFWLILSNDRDRLTRVLQGNGSLLVAGIAEVNTIDLERGEEAVTWDRKTNSCVRVGQGMVQQDQAGAQSAPPPPPSRTQSSV